MKYEAIISQMTLEEKASLCSGANFWNTKPVERLGIPGMMLTDGPHGVRKQGGREDHLGLNASVPATCYPTASAIACSWDEELIEEMGRHLGLEARSEGVSVLLGPGVNIKRSPLCGRNFEYMSEDPLLAGKCAAALIRGIQSNGVFACVKHFAANSQETCRMTSDSVVDERALRELYLPAFEAAVKEGGVGCVMTSYNKVNGVYANENPHLIRDILRGEWGYTGMVVSDWGGNNDRVAALKAGDELEMPSTSGETDRQIVAAVKDGSLDERILDARVDKLLETIFAARNAATSGAAYDRQEHHRFAREMASRCAVLLKNEGDILPLDNKKHVAVIGDFAGKPRYQGAGSSLINPTMVDSPVKEMKRAGLNVIGYEPGFKRGGGKSDRLIARACALAERADAAVLWLGLDEGSEAEGVDRTTMDMPENQLRLLSAVSAVNPNIVVVLSCGSPVEMDWDAQCRAVLHGYLGGQAGAGAIADILCGRVCPSGKLAETVPLKLSDVPCAAYYPGREATAEYRESIYVGYRYYDKAGKAVKYPFGHGLSYTRFKYSGASFNGSELSFHVQNIGGMTGSEVAQVYVSPRTPGAFRPDRELRGFKRVTLKPGETKTVTVKLDQRAFSYWNVKTGRWEVEEDVYDLLIGASSRDIRLSVAVAKQGTGAPSPYGGELMGPYCTGDVRHVSSDAFAALLGHEPPARMWDRDAPLDKNSTIGQGVYLKRGPGKLLYRTLSTAQDMLMRLGRRNEAFTVMFAMDMPYRGLSRMAGLMSEEQLAAFMKLVNGEKGALGALIKARRLGDE